MVMCIKVALVIIFMSLLLPRKPAKVIKGHSYATPVKAFATLRIMRLMSPFFQMEPELSALCSETQREPAPRAEFQLPLVHDA